jgi:hypothetical protein
MEAAMTTQAGGGKTALALVAILACGPAGQSRAENECAWLGSRSESASMIVWPSRQDLEYSPYGYSFPYVLYVPAKPLTEGFPYLIVEPNNPGDAGLSAEEQLVRAATAARTDDSSLGHDLADALKAPLLMPVFPRPKTDEGRSDLYTHALTREAMLVTSGPLYRLDLQLIAMADEARDKLARCGLQLDRKFVIEGFSASGMFANRFAFLHPDRIAAAAYGGTCGFLMLPVGKHTGVTLNYPLGTADYAAFAGREFDRKEFESVPQFAYGGAQETDKNDCVGNRDALSDAESALVRRLFGSGFVPDRWARTKELYGSLDSHVQIKSYPELGHVWYDGSRSVICDVTRFFGELAAQGPPACVTQSLK